MKSYRSGENSCPCLICIHIFFASVARLFPNTFSSPASSVTLLVFDGRLLVAASVNLDLPFPASPSMIVSLVFGSERCPINSGNFSSGSTRMSGPPMSSDICVSYSTSLTMLGSSVSSNFTHVFEPTLFFGFWMSFARDFGRKMFVFSALRCCERF